MRSDNDSRSSVMGRVPICASAVAMVMLVIFSYSQADGQEVERSSKLSAAEPDTEMVKKIKQHPDLPIDFETQEAAPLSIEQAGVKEITKAEFRRLTGIVADSTKYAAFPKVTLVNQTDKRMTGFALFLKNNTTGRTHFMKRTGTSIEPHSGYSVVPADWVAPEKLVQAASSAGEAKIIKKKASFDSGKMWLPASASDLALKVVEVYFEDGSSWSSNSSF
ncbi:MAG: hypothetical protein AABO41_23580 [Acidobacteriota bacterium]